MLVSRKLNCIFVHLQKTGGSSIRDALRRMDPDALTSVPGTEYKHVWARDLRPHLDAKTWDGSFKFAFVRNPWDRLVAWYLYTDRLRTGPNRERRVAEIAAVRELERCGCRDFEGFVRGCTSTFLERNGERVSFARSQLDHLSDDEGHLLVDFVGRFEDLDRDFATVLDRLGQPPLRLPHANAHGHRHYSTYYTPELRELVRERFRDDIDRFGYEFEVRGPWRDAARRISVTRARVLERTGRIATRVLGERLRGLRSIFPGSGS